MTRYETKRGIRKIKEIANAIFPDAQDIEIACDEDSISIKKNYAAGDSVYIFGRSMGDKFFLESDMIQH